MTTKFFAAGAIAAAALFASPAAFAGGADKDGQFYATPIQKGAPRDLPGERLIPGVDIAVGIVDGVARPIVVDPIQTAGASIGDPLGGPAPAAGPAAKGHRHHHRKAHGHASSHHHKAHHAGHAHHHGKHKG